MPRYYFASLTGEIFKHWFGREHVNQIQKRQTDFKTYRDGAGEQKGTENKGGKRSERKTKEHCGCSALCFSISLSAFYFVALQATCANVSGFYFSVLDDLDFLDIRLERSSRLAVTVAHVVAGILPLIADAAHSRHIHTSTVIIWQKIERGKSAPLKTSIDTIPKSIKKSNRFCMSFRIFSSKLKKQWGKVNFLLQNKRK